MLYTFLDQLGKNGGEKGLSTYLLLTHYIPLSSFEDSLEKCGYILNESIIRYFLDLKRLLMI